jgi:hypothetical protein
MPPKRKREVEIQAELTQAEIEARYRRIQARANSIAHGITSRQTTGRQNRIGMRGIRPEDARSAEAFIGHVKNMRHEESIRRRRVALMRTIAIARRTGNMGATRLHERMLAQLEHRKNQPGLYEWDDQGQDFIARHIGNPPGNYFWQNQHYGGNQGPGNYPPPGIA